MSRSIKLHGILSYLDKEANDRTVFDHDEQEDRPMRPVELFIERLWEKIPNGYCVSINGFGNNLNVHQLDLGKETLGRPSYEGLKFTVDLFNELQTEILGWPDGVDQWRQVKIRFVRYLADDTEDYYRAYDNQIVSLELKF